MGGFHELWLILCVINMWICAQCAWLLCFHEFDTCDWSIWHLWLSYFIIVELCLMDNDYENLWTVYYEMLGCTDLYVGCRLRKLFLSTMLFGSHSLLLHMWFQIAFVVYLAFIMFIQSFLDSVGALGLSGV